MARASTPTMIPLDRAAAVLGIDPLHFNAVVTQYGVPAGNVPPYSDSGFPTSCDDVWFQYAWQDTSKFAHEDLARVLNEAETLTSKLLGYYPIPQWIEDEEHLLTTHYQPELYSLYNTRGMNKSIKSRWGHVIEAGVRDIDPIELGAAVNFDDNDLDFYDETCRVEVATAITDIEEIRVFYPGEDGSVEWEIRPVDVEANGVTATITFPKYLAVLPELRERMPYPDNPMRVVDGDDNLNFLQTVDVYRVFNDDSQQVVFYIEPTSCTNATTYTGYMILRDKRRGFLAYQPAVYDENTLAWNITTCMVGYPLKAEFSYRAGLQNKHSDYPNLRMDSALERLLVYYAITLADKAVAGCNNFSSHLDYLNEDMAESDKWNATPATLDNPLGTKRAALSLWRYIEEYRLGETLRKGQ